MPLSFRASCLLIVLAACGGDDTAEPALADVATEAPAPEPVAIKTPDGEEVQIDPRLLDPAAATETAPDSYKVKFDTTEGDFVVLVHREWAPIGADRFYNLVKIGFYDDVALFRVISGFMAQFGIHGQPEVSAAWKTATIMDDTVAQSNKRGRLTFATSGPNTRTTQLFINYVDNDRLDAMGFSPFAEVVEGMDVVDTLYSNYGEGAPRGKGPFQGLIQSKGNVYLRTEFMDMDFIETARIVE